MRIRDLDSWPPAITDSTTTKVKPTGSLPATLKRCGVYSIGGEAGPYFSIVVEFEGRDWHGMIRDVPESLMRRLESTLRGHEGEPLARLGDLEVIDLP